MQHPVDAIAPSMPESALRYVDVNHCVPLDRIAPLLVRLTGTPVEEKGVPPVSEQMQAEIRIAEEDKAIEVGITQFGTPSVFACRECHGVLLQLKEGSNICFRCHTGHAFSVETLMADFTENTEDALWNAIRSIEESILLMRRMAEQLAAHDHNGSADTLLKKADDAQQRADAVRRIVMQHEKIPKDAPDFPLEAGETESV